MNCEGQLPNWYLLVKTKFPKHVHIDGLPGGLPTNTEQ